MSILPAPVSAQQSGGGLKLLSSMLADRTDMLPSLAPGPGQQTPENSQTIENCQKRNPNFKTTCFKEFIIKLHHLIMFVFSLNTGQANIRHTLWGKTRELDSIQSVTVFSALR